MEVNMTDQESKVFNNILKEAGIQYTERNGLYELNEEEDYIQTNGYNLLESIRRLFKTKTVEMRLE